MKTEERRNQIYNLLKRREEVTVGTLTELFSVSPMTIRRDLNSLENSNLITHTYGKARIIDRSKQEFSFSHRAQTNIELKQKVAQNALSLLKDISSFYVDGSSTAMELLKILPQNRSYTIMTNSFEALKLLCGRTHISAYAIGGLFRAESNSFDDDTSIAIAKQLYVEATITSCSSFSGNGIYIDGMTGTQIKRIMLENSYHNLLLADHSKAKSQGIFLLGTWDTIDSLITDTPVDSDLLKTLQNHNVKVYY